MSEPLPTVADQIADRLLASLPSGTTDAGFNGIDAASPERRAAMREMAERIVARYPDIQPDNIRLLDAPGSSAQVFTLTNDESVVIRVANAARESGVRPPNSASLQPLESGSLGGGRLNMEIMPRVVPLDEAMPRSQFANEFQHKEAIEKVVRDQRSLFALEGVNSDDVRAVNVGEARNAKGEKVYTTFDPGSFNPDDMSRPGSTIRMEDLGDASRRYGEQVTRRDWADLDADEFKLYAQQDAGDFARNRMGSYIDDLAHLPEMGVEGKVNINGRDYNFRDLPDARESIVRDVGAMVEAGENPSIRLDADPVAKERVLAPQRALTEPARSVATPELDRTITAPAPKQQQQVRPQQMEQQQQQLRQTQLDPEIAPAQLERQRQMQAGEIERTATPDARSSEPTGYKDVQNNGWEHHISNRKHNGFVESKNGWKFHLSVAPDDVPKATELLKPIVERYGIDEMKAAGPDLAKRFDRPNEGQRGKQLVMYDDNPNVPWDEVMRDVEVAFRENGIRPSQQVPENRPVPGSRYASYRNEGVHNDPRFAAYDKDGYFPADSIRDAVARGEIPADKAHNPTDQPDRLQNIDLENDPRVRAVVEPLEKPTPLENWGLEKSMRQNPLDLPEVPRATPTTEAPRVAVAEPPVARPPEAPARGAVDGNEWGLKRGAPAVTEEPVVMRRAAPAVDNNWGLARGTFQPDLDLPTALPEKISPVIERPHLGRPSMGKVVGVGGAVLGAAALVGTVAYESTGNKERGQTHMAGFVARGMGKAFVMDTGLRDIAKGNFGDAALAAGTVPLGIDLKGVVAQSGVKEAARQVPAERVASVQQAIAVGAQSKEVDPERVADPQLKFLFQLHALRAAGATKVNVVDGLDGTRLNGDGSPRGDIANAVQSNGGLLTAGTRYIDTFRSGNYQKAMGVQPFTDGRIYDADIDAMIDQATREYIAKGGSEIAVREATDLDFRAEQRFAKLYDTVPDANVPGYKHHSVEAVNGNVQLIEFRDLVQSGRINTPEGRARGVELSNEYYKAWDYDEGVALQFASRSYSRDNFTIARPEELVAAGMGPALGGLSGRPEDLAADMAKITKALNTDIGNGETIRSRINPGSDWTASAGDIYAALPPEMQQQVNGESARLQEQARALAAATPAPVPEQVALAAPEAPPKEEPQEDIVVTASVPRAELKARGNEVKDSLADKFRDAGVFAALDADGDGKLLLGEVIQAARAAGIRDANGGTIDSTDVNSGLAVNLIARMRDGTALG